METSAGAASSSDRMQMSIHRPITRPKARYLTIHAHCLSIIIRCEYNNRGGGGVSEIRQTWGGACPKSLKTPGLEDLNSAEC